MAIGRTTTYTTELADRICEIVATNPVGLPTICKMYPDLPAAETIRVWRWNNVDFAAKYTEAKRFQAEIMAESIEEITTNLKEESYIDDLGVTKIDSGMLGHARLVCDNRKWQASKLAPKLYGDRAMHEQPKGQSIQSTAEATSKIKEAEKEY